MLPPHATALKISELRSSPLIAKPGKLHASEALEASDSELRLDIAETPEENPKART